MLEHLQKQENIQTKLEEYTPEQIDQLYLRVFNTDDGELILKDLANRCFVNSSTLQGVTEINSRNEGRREVYMSIVSRMRNTISKKREDTDEENS